jgi:general secretion pathway protein G
MLHHGDAARVSAAHTDLQNLMMALDSYKVDTGEFPTTAQGLSALREKPDGVKGWAGPYIAPDIPKDPWNRDFVYRYPGEHGGDPDVICYGADGQPGGKGINADIGSWEDR